MFIILKTISEVEDYVYESYDRAYPNIDFKQPEKNYRNPEFTRQILDMLDRPDHGQYNILVTGSKGKGSVSRMVSGLLEGQGYKVGLFTSPHLVNFKERIRINGRAISDFDLIKYANVVKLHSDKIQKNLPDNKYIGPIGISAIMALLYFLDNKTDYNVIECGKGARYDDINQVYNSVAVINSIFEEHIPELGEDIVGIAYNKAGIIKDQNFIATVGQAPRVLEVIKDEAKKNKVELLEYEKDYTCTGIVVSSSGTQFNVKTKNKTYHNLNVNLLGRHQAKNAALALATVEKILGSLDYDKTRNRLDLLTWPGRLELINKNPTIILDGCINRTCTEYIMEALDEIDKKDVIFILGIPDDKDYLGVLDLINRAAKYIIMTKTQKEPHRYVKQEASNIENIYESKITYSNNIQEAIDIARSYADKEDLICIIGMQTLIRETKKLFNQDTLDLV